MVTSWDRLDVPTIDGLFAQERQILERVRQMPNGERLFLLDPIRALGDAGVRLGEAATAELLRMHPNLACLSPTPYDALKASEVPQPGQVNLRGLFRRDDR